MRVTMAAASSPSENASIFIVSQNLTLLAVLFVRIPLILELVSQILTFLPFLHANKPLGILCTDTLSQNLTLFLGFFTVVILAKQISSQFTQFT